MFKRPEVISASIMAVGIVAGLGIYYDLIPYVSSLVKGWIGG